jgi:hypothetical protein
VEKSFPIIINNYYCYHDGIIIIILFIIHYNIIKAKHYYQKQLLLLCCLQKRPLSCYLAQQLHHHAVGLGLGAFCSVGSEQSGVTASDMLYTEKKGCEC